MVLLEHLGDPLRRGFELGVDLDDVGELLERELLAGLADLIAWPDTGQDLPCLLAGQPGCGPARDQVLQQLVEPVLRHDPRLDELLASLGEQPQDCDGVIEWTSWRPRPRNPATATV